jgi:glycerol-3-phosphate dehydrogenase (NAD(P)+)
MKNDVKVDVDNLKIGVVGAGSWGTALANHLASKGFKIDLWAYEDEVKDQIMDCKENKLFLPGVLLSSNIIPSNNIAEVVSGKGIVLTVVPSHLVRETAEKFSDHLLPDTIIVSASKGIENKTYLTMTQVLKESLPHIPEEQIAVISGPSFAKEVARGVPTVVTVASKNMGTACLLQHVFASPLFRVYTSEDTIGVEIGGAVKNVIAIACGIVDGQKMGLNTRAAMITRGLAEIQRLGLNLGANPLTFAGLSGVGDLILTCTGELSRNHTVGKQLGEGKTLNEILSEMRMVAEGVKTARSVYNLAKKLDVEMPICSEVYSILYEGNSPEEAGERLMARELKPEIVE